MKNELIVIKQLPVIEEQLSAVKEQIAKRVNDAMNLVCTEETYKDVKKVRAELNKEFKEFETRRRDVKEAVMAPYRRFEGVYEECVGEIYKAADEQLKGKISEVENSLKSEKVAAITEYFQNRKTALGIDLETVTLETSGISVGMSSTVTSLKSAINEFLARVRTDLDAIGQMENCDEVMSVYQTTLNLSESLIVVNNRHQMIAAQKDAREQREMKKIPFGDVPDIPAYEAPKSVPDEILEDVFAGKVIHEVRVFATDERLDILKTILENYDFPYCVDE